MKKIVTLGASALSVTTSSSFAHEGAATASHFAFHAAPALFVAAVLVVGLVFSLRGRDKVWQYASEHESLLTDDKK